MKYFVRTVCVVAVVIALFLPFPGHSRQTQQRRILIGLIPEMNIFKQRERFRLLGAYLSKKTGMPVDFTILSRYGNIIDRFKTENMDGAFFGSFTGALAIQKLGVIPLARPVNLDNSSTYHGCLFVRKNSKIKNATDMKGKKMAFVEKATTAGYVFPLAYLRENGVADIDHFFGEYFFAGSHDAAIYAVLNGQADVGAAKHSIYDRVRKDDPRVDQELTILAESPQVPSNGLCVRKGLDEALKQQLKKALLELNTDPEGAGVLHEFGAIKFIETTVNDYQPVFGLTKKAGIDIGRYDYRNK